VWGLRLCVEVAHRRQHWLGASGGTSGSGEVGRALNPKRERSVESLDLGDGCSNISVVGKETTVRHGRIGVDWRRNAEVRT
jgi:hypothetical protein